MEQNTLPSYAIKAIEIFKKNNCLTPVLLLEEVLKDTTIDKDYLICIWTTFILTTFDFPGYLPWNIYQTYMDTAKMELKQEYK